jgi:NTE family protein
MLFGLVGRAVSAPEGVAREAAKAVEPPALPSAPVAPEKRLTLVSSTSGHDPTADRQSSLRTLPHTGGVALALGGGVAKGWAHIGVLRAFDEAKIPVKMIAGTSIGALAGGAYLAGKLDQLEEFARQLTWTGVLRYMDFSIAGAGLISGKRLASRMAEHLDGVTVENLPAPFVSICTDIRTGHEIWLHDGPLIDAIRASYALPGVFAPVAHNGRMLVDGALVNPVPVSACRAFEPDMVIAVNLNSDAFGRGSVIRSSHYEARPAAAEERSGAWFSFLNSAGHGSAGGPAGGRTRGNGKLGVTSVMIEAFNIIQDRIERARLAGDPPDYTIRPRLAPIGLADFHRADEAIRLGYQEASLRIAEMRDSGALQAVAM